MELSELSERAADARLRRAARRLNIVITKTSWRRGSVYNFGGYRIVANNLLQAGEKYDLTGREVACWLRDEAQEVGLKKLAADMDALAKEFEQQQTNTEAKP